MLRITQRLRQSFPLYPLFLLIILAGFVAVSAVQVWSGSRFAKQTIDSDIRQYKQQTHHNLQLFFDNQFRLLDLLLSQYAASGALLDGLLDQDHERAHAALTELYNSDSGTLFDLMFILDSQERPWLDASSKLATSSFPYQQIPFDQRPRNGWFIELLGDPKQPQLAAFKRMPLVDETSGRVMGHLVGGIALTGNLSVFNRARQYLNDSNLVIRFEDRHFDDFGPEQSLDMAQLVDELDQNQNGVIIHEPFVVSRYRLNLNSAPSKLEILTFSQYAMLSKSGFDYLAQSYQLIPLFVVIAAIMTLLLIRIGIQPLMRLVMTAKASVSEHRDIPFQPTPIREYNVIGNALTELITTVQEKEASLQLLNNQLEQRVNERTHALQRSNQLLLQARQRMVESEKQASLAQMVAGMAHEINTPLGVTLTAITTLEAEIEELRQRHGDDTLSKRYLQETIDSLEEGIQISVRNLVNTNELVGVFKQIAVDQASEMPRTFELKDYLKEIIKALTPLLKKTPHQVWIEGPDHISMFSYPGYLNQIITNLIQNSLIHGLDDTRAGEIRLEFRLEGEEVLLRYSDNGRGMDATSREHCFDPFYTTRRGAGSTGLGLSLIYNLTVQGLNGSLELSSEPGQGVLFEFRLPCAVEDHPGLEAERPEPLDALPG